MTSEGAAGAGFVPFRWLVVAVASAIETPVGQGSSSDISA